MLLYHWHTISLESKNNCSFQFRKRNVKNRLYKGRNIFKKVQAICFLGLCVSCDKFNFGVFKKTTLLLRVHLQGLQLQNKVLQKSHSIQ
ncbi:hypothetical protein M395_05700 [Enterococcus faecium T110]|nr:hypothetical protein M395_05700 [Enterococcus faecium T110]